MAWFSLQPDGSVSFGLNDKTYVSPRFQERIFVWNAFNRVTAEYAVITDPSAADFVVNPHFTFHPPIMFHLKSNKDKASRGEALFQGICDLNIVLSEQSEMPWLRVVTSPLIDKNKSGLDWKDFPRNDFPLNAYSEDTSIKLEVDFIRNEDAAANVGMTTWCVACGNFSVRISASLTNPQFATLGWFHSY